MKLRSLFVLFFFIVSFLCAYAGSEEPEIGIDEKLGTFIPKGITVTNESGEQVEFTSLIDKPTVLNLVYFRCPGICSPIMEGVAEMVKKSDLELGKDYQVFTVSFNHLESIELGKQKKENFMTLAENEYAEEHWKFFVAEEEHVKKLTETVGFKFKKAGNDFLHAGTLIMISPEGKITRYLNGTYFLPLEFKLALLEASEGKVGTTINRLLQFCYSYDPVGKGYAVNVTKIAGSIILFFGLSLLLVLLFYKKKKKTIT